jgi:CDP-diacylglycerol---glycerol-3-phosphate 3-phosphatidyltransferase
MNLPNKITIFRIFIVPVFMLFILPIPDSVVNLSLFVFIKQQMLLFNRFIITNGSWIAAVIFIIAASTDGIDGYIARKNKQITRLGKFLDPIADKLLIIAALTVFVQNQEISGWVAFIIIARELIVTGLRLIAAGEGIVIAASRWGKLKTFTQIIAITSVLLRNIPIKTIISFNIESLLMAIAVLATIYSGYDYIKRNINVISIRK